MLRPRVLIDGYNMCMPTGTGIATYARGLAAAAHFMGHRVDILIDPPFASAEAQAAGKSLFDRLSAPMKSQKLRSIRRIVGAARGVAPTAVCLSGSPQARAVEDRLPVHDRIWAISDVFEIAQTHYQLSGQFLEITVPEAPDVAHWTYTMPIRVVGAKNVYTIHDLVPMLMPDAVRVNRRRFFALTRQIAAQADHILTVSEQSKRDIIRLLGVSESRVTNTYQSIDLPPSALQLPVEEARREVEDGHGLPFGEYFLYFGAIEPKKNVKRLIQAYLRSGVRGPLAIVGKLAWDFAAEASLLSDPGLRYATPPGARPELRSGLKHFEYVSRDALVCLIRGAKAVLFPSLYEGFGLPAAEAMQLGAPVLASTLGALPEVCGEAALLVDPYDVDALADGVRRLDADHELRRALSQRGKRQAARFNLTAYASRLEALYENLAVQRVVTKEFAGAAAKGG